MNSTAQILEISKELKEKISAMTKKDILTKFVTSELAEKMKDFSKEEILKCIFQDWKNKPISEKITKIIVNLSTDYCLAEGTYTNKIMLSSTVDLKAVATIEIANKTLAQIQKEVDTYEKREYDRIRKQNHDKRLKEQLTLTN